MVGNHLKHVPQTGHSIHVHPRGGMYFDASSVCEYNSMSIDVHLYIIFAYLLGNDEQLHKLHNSLGITIRMPILLFKIAPQYQAILQHPCSRCARLSCVCIMSIGTGITHRTTAVTQRKWFFTIVNDLNHYSFTLTHSNMPW